MSERVSWRIGVHVRGKWQRFSNERAERPTADDARQVGWNVNASRSQGSPHIVDKVKIVRIVETDEEVIDFP